MEAAAAVAVVGHGGGYGGGDGGGNGGDKGGSPPDEDPEDDLSAFARRKCRRYGKVEYLRKGGCANPSCVAWLIVFQFFFSPGNVQDIRDDIFGSFFSSFFF